MKRVPFKGSAVAIVTPMHEDFSINYDKLGELIDWQIEQGTNCIVICGTTGESSVMTDEEHVECIRFAVEKAAGRVPVMAGCGSNDTRYAIWLSKEAKAAGADSLLHVTPYYNKTSQKGLVAHFYAIADATDLPIVLYNVPSRTGLNIQPQTYAELCKHPNIVATKEANNDIAALCKTVSLCGDDLIIYSGNDDQIVPILSMGGMGVISVLANIMPKETHQLTQTFFDGDVAGAAKMQANLMGIVSALFCDVNPIPVKQALNLMGKNVGPCRLPLVEMSDAGLAQLTGELKKWNLI